MSVDMYEWKCYECNYCFNKGSLRVCPYGSIRILGELIEINSRICAKCHDQPCLGRCLGGGMVKTDMVFKLPSRIDELVADSKKITR
jgi:Fe-S-cluster-containing hydrogenase component 2